VSENSFGVTTDAGQIAGAAGTGDGPDLLLLHGGPGISDYMALLAAETCGWRGIHYQQRGLAPSTTDGPFTVARHVADAIAVLDGLGVERTVVLGHSWGAHLALQVAMAVPDRVTGVVTIDGLGPHGDGHAPELGAELRARLTPEQARRNAEIDERLSGPDGSDADLVASTALLWGSYFADRGQVAPLPEDLRASLACANGTFGSLITEEFADDAFAGRLGGLTVPVVVLAGAASPMPVVAGEEIARLLPHGELVVVPDAGHLPWFEHPGCVADALARLRAEEMETA
jgi:pimeloyl-ACP methyl ester carboxylesterase